MTEVVEAKSIATILFVNRIFEEDAEYRERELPRLKRNTLESMSRLGTVVEGTLDYEVSERALIDGAVLPLTFQGIEVPDDCVLVRFSAMAIPHKECELVG